MISYNVGVRFNHRGVKTAMTQRYRRSLFRIGGWTRTTAKNLIRRRRSNSSPGQSPTNHTGAIRNFMRFAVNNGGTKVTIGPTLLPKPNNQLRPVSVSFPGRSATRLSILEFSGTERNKQSNRLHRMAARPFMRVALHRAIKSKTLANAFRDINQRI